MMLKAMATVVGNGVGEFIGMDTKNRETPSGMAMRLQVKIYITKPLKRALRVSCSNGQSTMVTTFTYECLSNFCYRCGILGHLLKDCRIQFDIEASSSEVSEDTLEWGEWLHTAPLNQTSQIIGGSLENGYGHRVFVDRRRTLDSGGESSNSISGNRINDVSMQHSNALIVASNMETEQLDMEGVQKMIPLSPKSLQPTIFSTQVNIKDGKPPISPSIKQNQFFQTSQPLYTHSLNATTPSNLLPNVAQLTHFSILPDSIICNFILKLTKTHLSYPSPIILAFQLFVLLAHYY